MARILRVKAAQLGNLGETEGLSQSLNLLGGKIWGSSILLFSMGKSKSPLTLTAVHPRNDLLHLTWVYIRARL